MLVFEVNQVKTVGENLFEVVKDGQVLYHAKAPWVPGLLHDALHQLYISTPEGEAVYRTSYQLWENVKEELIPFKNLLMDRKLSHIYSIIDKDDKVIGSVYTELKGFWDGKIMLQLGEKAIVGYRKSMGKMELISFYDAETDSQIGQLMRPNKVVDNKDRYMLHFVDGYDTYLPVMAFFTVYCDFLWHNNTGEAMMGTKIQYNYTYGPNDHKVNENFVLEQFGQAEVDRMNSILNPPTMVGPLNMKQFWTIFAIGWLVALLLVGGFLLILFLGFGIAVFG